MAATPPICEFGLPAVDFDLPATDGKRYRLTDVKGNNGLLVMFICNHCPYVKAVIDRIVRDCTELAAHGVGSIAIMSNDPTDYLASLWGLPSVHTTVAVAPPAVTRGIVRFKNAGHSSLFNPAINPAVTTEMQRETVTFAASRGSLIQISNASVVD